MLLHTQTGFKKLDKAHFLAKLVPLLLDNAILCSAITAPGGEEGVEEHPEDVRAYIEQAANSFSAPHDEKEEWITITPRGSGGDSDHGTPRRLSREEPLKNNAGSASNSFAALCEGETMEDGSDFYSEIDLEQVRSLRGQQVKTKKKARSSTKKIATGEGKHHTVNRQAVGEGIVEMWFNQDELDCQPAHTEWKVVKTRSIERGVLPASTYASQKISEANGENVARKQERKSAFNLKEGGGGPATYLVSSEDNSTQNYNDINNDVEEEEKEGKSSGEGAVKLEER